jgi:hypothetical protein
MTPTQTPFGFRVLGSKTARRRLVDAAAAFTAYCGCDPQAEIGREAYLSAFTYPTDFRHHLEETGSTKDYAGPCWAPWLWWDIDREDNLDAALSDARGLAAAILQRYSPLDDDDLLLFYSGAKGFHVGMPVTWGPEPSVDFNRVARRFAENLAALARVTIDTGVYDKVRLFRAPNSRHPKTGLHKRRLTLDELLHLDAGWIQRLAAAPESFEPPAVKATNDQAAADWQVALQAVEREAQVKAERRAALGDGTPQLNRATLDFICDGAEPDHRHRRLFSAAANLAEFGCPPALAHALLTEAALDCGLPPADVRRQIECGLAHGATGQSPPDTSTANLPARPAPARTNHAALQSQLAALWETPPADAGEAWESEPDRRDAGQHAFPFGVSCNDAGPYDAEGGRR